MKPTSVNESTREAAPSQSNFSVSPTTPCRSLSPSRQVKRASTPRIKSQAVLIGYDPQGACIYSEILDLSDYYDGEHVWDSRERVKQLKLQRVKGYLFDDQGQLDQEFESIFDLTTGIFQKGTARYANGTSKEW